MLSTLTYPKRLGGILATMAANIFVRVADLQRPKNLSYSVVDLHHDLQHEPLQNCQFHWSKVFSGICFFGDLLNKLAQAPHCKELQAGFVEIQVVDIIIMGQGKKTNLRFFGATELVTKFLLQICKMRAWKHYKLRASKSQQRCPTCNHEVD